MKKRGLALFLAVIIALFGSGCIRFHFGSNVKETNSQETNSQETKDTDTENRFGKTHDWFTGTYREVITVDRPVDLYGMVETLHGELRIVISDGNGDIYFKRENVPSTSFVVHLDHAGNYFILVDAKKHMGQFQFDWNDEGSDGTLPSVS